MKLGTINRVIILGIFILMSILGKSQTVYFPGIESDSVNSGKVVVIEYVMHPDGVEGSHSATVGQLMDSLGIVYSQIQKATLDDAILGIDSIKLISPKINKLYHDSLTVPYTGANKSVNLGEFQLSASKINSYLYYFDTTYVITGTEAKATLF
jgi:hypothetical protein